MTEAKALEMPMRPRQHQLEERSRRVFAELLPDHFIVRDKPNDYGVDLEIEIFERRGPATGLIAHGQIKATDDLTRARALRLTRSQRNYLEALNQPTLLLRWCAADGSLWWKWLDSTPPVSAGADSQTISFDDNDRWDVGSPDLIEARLRARRAVERHPPDAPVTLLVDLEAYPPVHRQPVLRALRQIVEESSALTLDATAGMLTAYIRLTPQTLEFGVGSISNLNVDHNNLPPAQIETLIRYTLSAALLRLGLRGQADRLARGCLAAGVAAEAGPLGPMAVRALSSSAVQAVELAILNGMHGEWPGPLLIWQLLEEGGFDTTDRRLAGSRFLEASLAFARGTGYPEAEGAVYYSLGSFYTSMFAWRKAIHAFNRARRLRPAYAETGYFLSEVAGALFSAGRFTLSARIYAQAMTIDPSARLALHHGDSLFFSGSFAGAAKRYDEAIATGSGAVIAEAAIKRWLLDPLVERFGYSLRLNRTAMLALDGEERTTSALDGLDPTDPLANFNRGIALAIAEHHAEAARCFLLCAFRQSGDGEAWRNALLCAANTRDDTLFTSTLAGALALGGPHAADGFAERTSEPMSAAIVEMIAAFNYAFGSDKRSRMLFRILGSDKVVTFGANGAADVLSWGSLAAKAATSGVDLA